MADPDAKGAALNALDAVAQGGGAATAPTSPYRITVRTGPRRHETINPGQLGENTQGHGVDRPHRIEVNTGVARYDVSDEGIAAAIGTWYSFSDEYRSDLMKRMWFLGLTKSPTDFDGAFKAWQGAVGHAANFAAQGREIDPQDVLEMLADGEQGATKRKQGPHTQRSIDLTDPATAREWVQQAFKQSMGRRAEDAEVRALVAALHEQQQANPTVSTTTPTKWDEQGNAIDSTTTQTGGVDPDAFFAQRMAADPEAGAHQAAASLFPALMQALGAGA